MLLYAMQAGLSAIAVPLCLNVLTCLFSGHPLESCGQRLATVLITIDTIFANNCCLVMPDHFTVALNPTVNEAMQKRVYLNTKEGIRPLMVTDTFYFQ